MQKRSVANSGILGATVVPHIVSFMFLHPNMFSSHPMEETVCIQGTTLEPPSVNSDMAMLLDGLGL